jgi:hypothetical protein
LSLDGLSSVLHAPLKGKARGSVGVSTRQALALQLANPSGSEPSEMPMAEISSTTPSTLKRRHSAAGKVLHHFSEHGTPTTIHAGMELESSLSRSDLVKAVDKKLLSRFPRFRGHVSANGKVRERHSN